MTGTTYIDSTQGLSVKFRAEKILTQPIHSHLITYCPTMDLVAVVTQDEQLDVYRVEGGQRAFGLKRKSPELTIDQICWKFNGIVDLRYKSDFSFTVSKSFL